MLINVSRFTAVQSSLKELIAEYLQTIRDSILNHSKLQERFALNNNVLSQLKFRFEEEYGTSEFSCSEVQPTLKEVVSKIGVIEVNSSHSAEPLDYSEKKYPNGRNVIAVGGLQFIQGPYP